jgi:hypothetical protein
VGVGGLELALDDEAERFFDESGPLFRVVDELEAGLEVGLFGVVHFVVLGWQFVRPYVTPNTHGTDGLLDLATVAYRLATIGPVAEACA